MSEATTRLLAEIAEQPDVIRRALAGQRPRVERLAERVRALAPTAVVLVARGSSDNAAVYGRYLLEVRNRQLCALAAPSTVTLYGAGPQLRGALVLALSQSGQGEDIRAYVSAARAQGALTAAITNDAGSPLASVAEHVLACEAGDERSVPATKTVAAQMSLLAALSSALAGGDLDAALGALPQHVEQALAAAGERAPATAARIAQALGAGASCSVMGRGFAYPVALELALKLKETCDLQAEPFSAADFFHGPVALVDREHVALVVDVGGQSTAPALAAADEIARRGGTPVLLRVGATAASGHAELCVPGDLPESLGPLPGLMLAQQLCIALAHSRGLDPAQARGLTKVTSTR